MEKVFVIGNWKMNLLKEDIFEFIQGLKGKAPFKCESWIAPQAVHASLLQEHTKMHGIEIGAQNCSQYNSGAYTGEISPQAIKDLGMSFCLIGHSERRQIFKESNETINLKLKAALSQGLKTILCLGESLEQRENEQTKEVLREQLHSALKDIEETELLLLAYEPVWAIGTGKTASPEQAEEVHAYLRHELQNLWKNQASKTVILYGGSVKPSNFEDLLKQENINGGLVGGASLKASDFSELCQIASKKA